jgi:hypothetical protein
LKPTEQIWNELNWLGPLLMPLMPIAGKTEPIRITRAFLSLLYEFKRKSN